MILYEGGEDIPIRKINKSKTYLTGSLHDMGKYGLIKILGQVDKYHTQKNGTNTFYWFLISFIDGTLVVANKGGIRSKSVKNPNYPTVFNKGFIGQGKYLPKTHRKTYLLWQCMLKRCYYETYHKNHPSYKNATVDERWHNFQNFCEDIQHLEGYSEWKKGTKEQTNPYQLDKDIKIKENKIYSKDACLFVTKEENNMIKDTHNLVTGKTYVATRISDGYQEEFTNQTKFAKKYSINRHCLNRCCVGKHKTAYGWKIEIKEHKNKKNT